MFIGRSEELNLINKILLENSACVMIYGKRKVGKTTLIKKALENSEDITIYYECIKASLIENIDGLVKVLVRNKVFPIYINFSSFLDLFCYLNTLHIKLNIVIDEYPYLKSLEKPEYVDSIFQSIIDNNLKNIKLFLSGSHIGMMRDLLEEKNALYGRFTLTIHLKELDYACASRFYNNKSNYEKIGFYAVFGGSPYINNAINSQLSLKENIINTILNKNSYIYTYIEHLLISDYTNQINAERIFASISNGHKKYSDIETKLSLKSNGNLAKQLQALERMQIISKKYPINKMGDNKKAYYEVNDNLLRFYYTYVYRNKSILEMLGAKVFYEEYIENSIVTFISHRFEEISRTYFSMCVKNGLLRKVTNIGTYYYDDSKNKTNGEFDVVLERYDNSNNLKYDIFEVKYYKEPLKLTEMNKEFEQVKSIKQLNVDKVGFICTSGYEKNDNYICIDIDDMFK